MTKFGLVTPEGKRLPISDLKVGDWVPSWGTVIMLALNGNDYSGRAALFGPDDKNRDEDGERWANGELPVPAGAKVKLLTMNDFARVERALPQKHEIHSSAGYIGTVTVQGYEDSDTVRVIIGDKTTIWVDPDELIEAAQKAKEYSRP